MKYGRQLKLGASPGVVEIEARLGPSGSVSPQDATKLLKAIISQAWLDQMTVIVISIEGERNTISMRYFGPDQDGTAKWWDMIPPPIEAYPSIVQCVMALADLEPCIPFRGVLECKLQRRRVQVSFELRTLRELILRFNESVGEAMTSTEISQACATSTKP